MTTKEINKLFKACIDALESNPSQSEETLINTIASLHNVTLDENAKSEILRKIERYFAVAPGKPHILDDEDMVPWLNTVDSDEYYSQRYHEYLCEKSGLPRHISEDIESINRLILNRMGNPKNDSPFKRQGLVVGNVQSGKTANYLSLINLAADYGYKLIILIAGVHNNLRSQTQRRVNEGFIGFEIESQSNVGVGLPSLSLDSEELNKINTRRPHCFTNLIDDFNAKNKATTGLGLENAKNPIIMVVKKERNTLRNIIDWLRGNEEGQRFISFPALIIDDEADNASINTKDKPNETTRINGQIRKIFNLFKQGSYVGYTATPFANIFIDPDVYDDAIADDLFPKHFIFSLDAPSNYFGPTEFFLDDENNPNYESKYVEIIDDYKEILPVTRKKDFVITDLPLSLVDAIYHFITSIVIKETKHINNSHASMLINVSHKTHEQFTVSRLVTEKLSEIKDRVLYQAPIESPEDLTDQHVLGLFKKLECYRQDSDWGDWLTKLQKAVKRIEVRTINSQSPDRLNYNDYADDGLQVIAIGGYTLSRGFTLEGLTTSYLIRNTSMSDTLLQMGRWFGYRDDYNDLCKLYLPERSFSWYAFIAQSLIELKNEFIVMEQRGLRPTEYGLRVRSSKAGLLITARNKMRSAGQLFLSRSYSAGSFTLHGIRLDCLDEQRHLYKTFTNQLTFSPAYSHENNKFDDDFHLSKDVSIESVLAFIKSHHYFELDDQEKEGLIDYITQRTDELKLWDVVTHGVYIGKGSKNQKRTFPQSAFPNDQYVQTMDGGGRIVRPWEEAFGLSEEEYNQAEKKQKKDGVKQTARFFRQNRTKPLLVLKSFDIYCQTKVGQNVEKKIKAQDVPAFAISFPKSKDDRPVQYACNPVYMRKYFGEDDSEEDESDI